MRALNATQMITMGYGAINIVFDRFSIFPARLDD